MTKTNETNNTVTTHAWDRNEDGDSWTCYACGAWYHVDNAGPRPEGPCGDRLASCTSRVDLAAPVVTEPPKPAAPKTAYVVPADPFAAFRSRRRA